MLERRAMAATAPRRDAFRTAAVLVLVATLAASGCVGRQKAVASWDPAAFQDIDTLQFRTTGPEEGEHWSTVWLVVLDGWVYVRLGARASDRMQRNTTAPLVAVRLGGREYPRVRVEEAKDMVERVAAAMAEKYPTDFFIRHADHPLTLRLVPDLDGGR
jgi:hypothetical protein